LKAAVYGGLAGRLAGVPVIWHIRDRIAADYLPRPAVHLIHGLSRVLPTAVIVNSAATLATVPGVRHSTVLYNPIVPDAVPAGERTGRVRVGRPFTVGVVGRLAPWKGQDVFLRAFAAGFRGSDARAHVIGSAMFGEDSYEVSLRGLVKELGIAEQVDFRGFREDVQGELEELDVLVHCSLSAEPFGQVIIEGMSAGIPVIAAAAGGPLEIITQEVDGFLTPPGDVDALKTTLSRLAKDAALRYAVGEAGRQSSRRFSPEATAQQLLEVYRSVLTPSAS
jgi:glycosyltransferase involved in cell wall biosynthesis